MEWKLLWVVLVAFLLGGWGHCDGCWDQEKIALLQLKPFFSHIKDVGNWAERNSSSNCCEWERVECDTFTGRVTRLSLNSTTDNWDYELFYDQEYLVRSRDYWYLNASLFLAFEELQSLDLSGNSIAGCVNSKGFEKLSSKLDKLEILDLSNNYFNGSILASLSELSSLKSLNLASNQFTGSNLSDGIKMLTKLKNLETLDLSSNMFGSNTILNLRGFTSLRSLSLENCGLKGTFQMLEINNLMNLKELYLGGNEIESLSSLFQGEIKLIKLEVLDLSDNLFNNNIFSFLRSLSNLKSLDLRYNTLKGPIQIKELNALSNLEELDMSENQVNDFVPSQENDTELRLMNLEVLDLSGNLFNNSILSSLGRLSNLKSLDLSYNDLKGSINLTELRLKNLEMLDLTENVFNIILSSLSSLSNLKTLSLGSNELNGSIDLTELNALTHLENLDIRSGYNATDRNCSLSLQSLISFPSLKTLHLTGFSFQGMIMTSQNQSLNFINLEELILEGSLLQTNFLHSIREFTSLKRLSLYVCEINGSLILQEFTFLKHLSFYDCKINGSLTLQESHNFTNLEELILYDSTLQTNFLRSIGQFPSLKRLLLGDCKINETFSGFCELTNLQHLIIRNLNLKGDLPDCFSNLTFLEILDLSSNQFSGNINALESLTSLQVLSLSNNYFQIPISLEPLFNLAKLKRISADNNAIYPENQMHSMAPTFQLEEISLSCCGDVKSFPEFLYHQRELLYLDLSNIYFKGNQFPSWLLENNSKLESLFLTNSCLSGPLQLPLASHMQLEYLEISSNFFNGSIPVEIGAQLPSLRSLNMSKNCFNGRIPSSFGAASWPPVLSNLDVSNNQLSGTIPKWMGNMSSLNRIIMSNNSLEGTIPVEFCRLDLILLDLSVNNISGSLPFCFGPSNVRQVHLSKNRLRGGLPVALRNSSTLVTLDISDNFLNGSIPSWIGGLSELSYLLLSNNNFEGGIPMELCNLSHLSLINLSHNNLSGRIPSCLKIMALQDVTEDFVYNLIWNASSNIYSFYEPIKFTIKNVYLSFKGMRTLPYMSGIDLSCNKLVGEIPSEFGNFYKMLVLNLSHNSLTGVIPPTFANLREIESLDLSYNHLNGTIPPQLVGLTFLSCFNVSFNNLSGKTPGRTAEFGTFDESSYRGNRFLCGEPLPKCTDAEPPSNLLIYNREDDGSIDTGVFYVSFIVSYIVMLLATVAVLYINPYWRRAWFYRVEIITTSCYYFVVDNVLPRRFHCGNM